MSTHDVMADDLTLYAMGALDPGESARIAAHVQQCVSCRTELQRIHADLGLLALSAISEAQPPSRARERLLLEIASEARPITAAARRDSALRWWFAMPVFAVIVLAVGLAFLGHQNVALRQQIAELHQESELQKEQSEEAKRVLDTLNAPDAMRVTLVSTKTKPQPQAQTIYSKSSGRLVLVASNLESIPSNMAYELWLLPMSGAPPMPAGMFKPDERGNAQLLLPQIPPGMDAKGFAVTMEPEQGSPAPTSPIMMVGTTQ